jgi:WD40 repeat protein
MTVGCLVLLAGSLAGAEPGALKEEASLPLRTGWLAFNRKGTELMACVDTDVKILDARTLKVRQTLIATGSRAAFALDDRALVVSGVFQSGIELVDRGSGESRIVNYGAVDFQCHPGLNIMAYRAKSSATLGIYDLAAKKVLRQHLLAGLVSGPVLGGFSAKGTLLAGFSTERVNGDRRIASYHLLLWAPPSDRAPITFECRSQAGCLAISADGRLAAVGTTEGLVEVHDLASRKRLHARELGQRSAIEAVAFSPDGKLLATLAVVGGPAQELGLQDARTGRLLGREVLEEAKPERMPAIGRGGKRISFHVNWPGLVFFPDGKRLAVSVGGSLKVWKINPTSEKSK